MWVEVEDEGEDKVEDRSMAHSPQVECWRRLVEQRGRAQGTPPATRPSRDSMSPSTARPTRRLTWSRSHRRRSARHRLDDSGSGIPGNWRCTTRPAATSSRAIVLEFLGSCTAPLDRFLLPGCCIAPLTASSSTKDARRDSPRKERRRDDRRTIGKREMVVMTVSTTAKHMITTG